MKACVGHLPKWRGRAWRKLYWRAGAKGGRQRDKPYVTDTFSPPTGYQDDACAGSLVAGHETIDHARRRYENDARTLNRGKTSLSRLIVEGVDWKLHCMLSRRRRWVGTRACTDRYLVWCETKERRPACIHTSTKGHTLTRDRS